MDHIVQSDLPTAPWRDPGLGRLPGLVPLGAGDWLQQDEAFDGQMALRDRLVQERRDEVIAETPEAGAAVAELYDAVLAALAERPGYRWADGACTRPDGVRVALDEGDRLGTLARLVQDDLCLLQKAEGAAEHVLTAAILCFPASWTLVEKIGRPLVRIHEPVDHYDPEMARRVQRLFDHLRVGAPLWRQNALVYADPALHQPRREGAPRNRAARGQFLRSERQTLLRLPETGAVVFSIHTYVLPLERLDDADRAAIAALGI